MFPSRGADLAGVLYRPRATNAATAALLIVGPYGSVKEQAPTQYATRMAAAGHICLVFDAHGSGASGGLPARTEGPAGRLQDMRAAMDFLVSQPGVDPTRIGGVGICQGASYMIMAAAMDPRFQRLAMVSGQYLYPENLDGFFSGGGPTLQARIARGQAAAQRQRAGGPTEYLPVIHPTDKTVALPWPQIKDWFARWNGVGWGEHTRWENRIAAASDADVWSTDMRPSAERLSMPTLIIHGEQSDGFVIAAETVYARLTMTERRMVIVPGIFHTRFYDDPEIVGGAVAELLNWFAPRV